MTQSQWRWSGEALRDTLNARGISIRQFHKMLADAGIELSSGCVRNYLYGATEPRISMAVRFALVLGMRPVDITSWLERADD